MSILKNGTLQTNNLSLSRENLNKFRSMCIILYHFEESFFSSRKAVVNIKRKESTLHKMRELVEEGYKSLLKMISTILGKLLHKIGFLKKIHEEISNNRIDEIHEMGLNNGAIGGKLLGAGSGGFILFCVKIVVKTRFYKKFSSDEIA